MGFLWRLLEQWVCPRLPADVFVVCAKGEPVLVCMTHAAVEEDAQRRPQPGTRIFRVQLQGGNGHGE